MAGRSQFWLWIILSGMKHIWNHQPLLHHRHVEQHIEDKTWFDPDVAGDAGGF